MGQSATPSMYAWVAVVWLLWLSFGTFGYVAATGKTNEDDDLKAASSSIPQSDVNFDFSFSIYNGTIVENTIGKVYIQTLHRMGIYMEELSTVDIEYSIVGGDPHQVFKAEATPVKDFCFLRIRTGTAHYGRLNREFHSEFHLRVKARGSFPGEIIREAFVDVYVKVLDENEFNPLFPNLPYEISIPEDTPLHQSIGQVHASDADTGINGDIYYSFIQATLMFAVHPSTGVVSLTRPVSYNHKKFYELDVIAEDRGIHLNDRSRSSSHTKFKINILPVNFNPPNINVKSHKGLAEHSTMGSVFAMLTVTDPDQRDNGAILGVQITNDPQNIFRLATTQTRGEYNVEVIAPVDRETIPENYNITVIAVDKGSPAKTATAIIPIKVQDINDNDPEFDQNVYSVRISEIAPMNTPLLFVRATDKDLGSNAEVRYSIVDGDPRRLFQIDSKSGMIRTAKLLDVELDSKYSLVVQAQDQANSGSRKTGQARVNIIVEDYNDNAPVFHMNSDVIEFKENLPKGAKIATVQARDADEGDNGRITYNLINFEDVPFELDSFSGDITTQEVLDFETMRKVYQLHIRASDWGTPFKHETDMILTLKLKDVNDNSPEFEKVQCSGYLSRESPLNLEVVQLTAIDFDSGNIISYSIADGNADDCFSIDPSTGSITVNCDMSRYHDGTRYLVVVANDGEQVSVPTTVELNLVTNKRHPSLAMDDVRVSCKSTDVTTRRQQQIQKSREANAEVKPVTLEESNKSANQAPTVAKTFVTEVEISESAPVGTAVLNFGASVHDSDVGYNGEIIYVISTGDDKLGKFKLNTFTGELLVFSELDFESKREYSLVLTAFDLGHPSLQVSKEVIISLLDENDNAPVFQRQLYERKLNESSSVNSTVLQVHASDIDTGDNARVAYSIISDDRDFFIDPVSGIIKVRSPLDRETKPDHSLVIRAEDFGSKVKLSSTTVVNISITDVNDNVPIFVPDKYLVRIREDLPVGAVVTTLTAHDLDEGSNGRVTYFFTNGKEQDFEIDDQTGTIRIMRKLDYESTQVYSINATAQDAGRPSLKSYCLLQVEVMDVDENVHAPEFPSFMDRGSVDENLPIGSYVMHVEAMDRDDAGSGVGQVVYSIQNGTGLGRFNIDANGTIRTSQVLDRETSSHFWLTIIAQDRALVPRFTRLEVLIEVDDVNDNIPQSWEPAYYASVLENSPEVKKVVQIRAWDGDVGSGQRLHYSITSGNPQNFFSIDPDEGIISTTTRMLDREKQGEHSLEVTISDRGEPRLSSTTRVHIKVIDENDNKPEFIDRSQRISVFATQFTGQNIFIYRALAHDADEGRNSLISYTLRASRDSQFLVERKTGNVYSKGDLMHGMTFDLQIRATDHGVEPRKSQMRLRIDVIRRRGSRGSAPKMSQRVYREDITETDLPGRFIMVLSTEGDIRNQLRYAIEGGNEKNKFTINPDHGSIFLAKRVDWEKQSVYNLTVSVSDGVNKDTALVIINIIDINDNEPVFSHKTYYANVSESAAVGDPVIRVYANDLDEKERLLYTIASAASTRSRQKFSIGAKNGVIVVSKALDREDLSRHLLTVMVRDQGVPAKRGFARVDIRVIDSNDHKPRFLSATMKGQVYETAAIGTSVIEVKAMDEDKGPNAELTYRILSGNADNTFTIDPDLGIISVAKELDQSVHSNFELTVTATDKGQPPLSSQVEVDIDVTVSTNSPPRFLQTDYTVELIENYPRGTVIASLYADSLSTVTFAITAGDPDGYFSINPNSGVIYCLKSVDYEEIQSFNLTVTATNIIASSQVVSVIIHIVDVNDNAPKFQSSMYTGSILESAIPGSMILDTSQAPLVIQATDLDSNNNARLFYEIVEEEALQFFVIDPNTGALRTSASLDYEAVPQFEFTVKVRDSGKVRLQARKSAKVVINVIDVNDRPPKFEKHLYNIKVLLPIYSDVSIVQVKAIDEDTVFDAPLSYSIISEEEESDFGIDTSTGIVHVLKESIKKDQYVLNIQASDGKFNTLTKVFISVQPASEAGIKFTAERYAVMIQENKAVESELVVIQPVGLGLGTHLTFNLLNNHNLFKVGQTSGVLSTAGVAFDREEKDSYTVVIKVDDGNPEGKSAHVVVDITVEDTNDNAPMFVNLPYRCTVSSATKRGKTIQVVTATDVDASGNGELKYSLADTLGDKFEINPDTREILVRELSKRDENTDLTLKVIAQDQGSPPLSAVASIHIHVIDSSSPMFEESSYEASVPENASPHTPIVTLQARSPYGQKLLYSISRGDKYGEFALDFNTGVMSVIGHLDFEDKKQYVLTVRATDIFSGNFAEVEVIINVEDVNDNPPSFDSLSYTKALSEAAILNTPVLRLNTSDSDSGANALIGYSLAPVSPESKDVQSFQINAETGVITLKKSLDHEKQMLYQFLVVAKDNGMPVLTATASVILKVTDINDNPPAFTQPSYSCYISDLASRGQLVFKITAYDPDDSDIDNLLYYIVGGNDKFTFSMDAKSGIISLSGQRQPSLSSLYTLNVSVTDGVFTSFARLTVSVRNTNNFAPVFEKAVYNGVVTEMQPAGTNIITASAKDKDRGNYGMLTYAIENDKMSKLFSIDADTGQIATKKVLDREKQSAYDFKISATDNGGRMGFASVIVRVRDENDNAPEFLMSEYKVNIASDSAVDTPIVKIQAEDADEGSNGKVIYKLHPGENSQISELFEINAYSGLIATTASLHNAENQIFQFFVKAEDQGETRRLNQVPVEILVHGKNDTPPSFPVPKALYFVRENERVGEIIATVKARSVVPVTYYIVPQCGDCYSTIPHFDINNYGQIRLIGRLDRETKDSYVIFVRAQTRSSPALVDHMEIKIRVRDVNDNMPLFSCYPYHVTVPENANLQSSIVQLQATDLDLEVKPLSFAYGPGMNDVASIFSIDPESGWIVLLTQLDRELQSQYNLTVIVSDHPKKPQRGQRQVSALTSTTSVIISVNDVNDNAPRFQRTRYTTAVNEGALPSTVLLELSTVDADTGPNSEVTFYIVEGDQLGQFQIHRTGELFVNKALDRETKDRYTLKVVATDGAFVTYATVKIDILDDNDNAPVCDQPFHKVIQNEDIIKGTPVAHIRATDADEPDTTHTAISFSVEGDRADYFMIDKKSGLIRTAKLLDRETRPEFKLTAIARDGGGLSCSTMVLVFLKDVNDNAPVFPPGSIRDSYNVKEDAKIHTLVTRIAAIDADNGINSQIRYRLAPSSSGVFVIDQDSGIISVVASLDREVNPSYNLTVIAFNPTSSKLSTEAAVHITVLDVNDNPPEFERSSYYSSVIESANIGALVTKVRASSLDIGINADISYSIAAGNEQGKFEIDTKSGELTVAEPLDHEVSREYVLTVLAMDKGIPPLTNSAIVSINITDVNDSPPRFSQDGYLIHVREDVEPRTEVFKVAATDSDSPPNAKITYSIIDGNRNNQFVIDPRDGIIEINNPLDREMTGSYSLVIQAHDSGIPMLLSSAAISVIVDDVNDNPPRFSQDEYKSLVQEGRRTGIEILSLSVADDDMPENGRPFTFEIIEGNDDGEFHINNDGLLTTAGKLSKKVQERYKLVVRAYDSGKPPLHSDSEVMIDVVDDSLYPPEVHNMAISIRSCMDSFQGGVIGKVEARDRDPYDKTIFSIISPNSHLFDIHRDDGRLIALTGLDSGGYLVNVSVSDGKYTSYGSVTIKVVCTSNEVLESSVTIRFENLRAEQFYANFKDDFQRIIKRELDVRMNDVEIINVQPSSESQDQSGGEKKRHRRDVESDLDVLFAVRKSADRYFNKRSLKRKVERIRGRIESVLGVSVSRIFSDMCTKSSCSVGSCVSKVKFDESSLVPITVNGESFVSARHKYIQQCICLQGDCAEQVCGETTCTANKVCQKNAFGDYSCQCPEGRTGDDCSTVIPLCSGSSCPIERPMTFAGKSFAKWKLQHSTKKRFSLKFRLRTRQNSAVLMHAKGKVDYSILKIEGGSLVYKFDCGSGEGMVHIPVDLSDGQWHTIELDRNGREAELSLDSSYTSLGVSPGVHAILNVETEEIYFGAEVDVFPNGFRDVSKGFEGCMEDIRIFNIPLPFSGNNDMAQALEFENVEFHCQDYPAKFNPSADACSSNPCLNGGQCKYSGLNSYICVCRGRYRGSKCEIDPDPCADKPCHSGGRCEIDHEVPNSFLCHCKENLIGVRCSYGRFCRPNPCKKGGICVEGPTAPLCDCQLGFEGLYCDKTADACESSPCLNEGVCQSVMGTAYYCNCSSSYSGKNCEYEQIKAVAMTSSSSDLIYGIAATLGVILVIAIIVVACLVWRRKKRERRRNNFSPVLPDSGSEDMLSPSKEKRCKLSNPDLSVAVDFLPSQPPPVPTRPISYTPSTHDSANTLNNLDSVRNYGSAADELENTGMPQGHIPDYFQYVESFSNSKANNAHHMLRATPPIHSSRTASETDSIQKAPWEFDYPNILDNYMDGDKKHHDKLVSKRMPGVHSPQPSPMIKHGMAKCQAGDTASLSSLPVSESEDDLNGYHWDTSDWAPGPSMPNISEIPPNEILDSPTSSQPSDDCNANAGCYDDALTTAAIYNNGESSRDDSPLLSSDEQRKNNIEMTRYPTRDNENIVSQLDDDTEYMEDSEYVGDSEYADNEPFDQDDFPPSYADHPKYEQLLNECIHVRPDHYHLHYDFSTSNLEMDPLTEDENTDKENNAHDMPLYDAGAGAIGGEQPLRPPKEFMTPGYLTEGYTTDQDPPSRLSFMDDMSMSMGDFTSNASDISGLCEIEDSEINASDTDDENTPLNPSQLQTQV